MARQLLNNKLYMNVKAIYTSVREMLVYNSCHTGLVRTTEQYFREDLEYYGNGPDRKIKILGSRATGKRAATRTSPVTKSGAKSGSGTKTGSKSGAKFGSKSGPNSSQGSKSGINHSTGGIQSSMVQSPTKSGPNTSTGGTQSSLVLAMLIKELKGYRYSAVA
jgi:hypothetical protein